jgi:hypothetical protein
MFVLEDGRKSLFQWDLDRRLIVEDPTVTEVHFCNRTDECSLVVETYLADKLYADIPNVLLQNRWDIRAFAYCGTGYTKVEEVFEVKPRSKPSDYVYTETEVKRYEDLEKHLDERLDEIAKEGIKPDLEGYATEEYVDNAIEAIEIPEVDLTGYATEGYVDEAIKGIEAPTPDLTGYATEDYVNKAIEAIPETDLSDYALKTDIPKDYITEIPSEYVTDRELQAKGYSTFSGRYEDLLGKPDIPSTDGLAPVTYVDNKFNSINLDPYAKKADLVTYAKKTDIPDHSQFLTSIPSEYITQDELYGKHYATENYVGEAINKAAPDLSGFATEDYVDEAIAQASLGAEIDLSAYAKKTDIPDVSDFISEIPSEYVTENELKSKGFATETYVGQAIAGLEIPEASLVYIPIVLEPEPTAALAAKIEAALAANLIPVLGHGNEYYFYASKWGNICLFTHDNINPNDVTDLSLKQIRYNLSTRSFVGATPNSTLLQMKVSVNRDGATETLTSLTVDGVTYAIPTGGSADLSNYYTKEETEAALEGYYTKQEIDDKGYMSTSQAMGLFYTQAEVENKIDLKIANVFNEIGNAEGGAY